jgi:DNA-binding Lrp family transcriptional regulator
MPSETDWILIYWLLLEPRIRVNDLAKKASVTEKTVSRRLEAMSKKHVLEFSVQFNPAAMSNYLYFRIMVMIDQSLRDNIIRQINMISDGHFMYIVPPTSESALFFILFARNPPELEAVTNKLRSLKGVFKVGSYTPLKAQIYHKLLLDEISKKVAIPGKRRVPLVLEGA